jgi:hypothetical protein
MHPISDAQLADAAAIMGAAGATDDSIEAGVGALLEDRLAVRRVIDWLPEAFALVVIPQIGPINLPTTFSARAKNGRWVELGFDAEPIVQSARRLGAEMYRVGSREVFANIALRSALLVAVNKALNAKCDLEGMVLSGPALIGVPAEVYLPPQQSFWSKLFR